MTDKVPPPPAAVEVPVPDSSDSASSEASVFGPPAPPPPPPADDGEDSEDENWNAVDNHDAVLSPHGDKYIRLFQLENGGCTYIIAEHQWYPAREAAVQ